MSSPLPPFLITAANLASVRPPLDAVFAALTNSDVDGLVSLDLSGASISDADWPRLKRLSHLRRLLLEGTVLSGPGLERLGGFTNLDELVSERHSDNGRGIGTSSGSQKADEPHARPNTRDGRRPEAGCRPAGIEISASAEYGGDGRRVKNLEPLTGLQSLVLEGTRVSDAGLISLRPLTELINLSLANTAVTEPG